MIDVLETTEEAEGGVGGAAGMKKDCGVLVIYVVEVWEDVPGGMLRLR